MSGINKATENCRNQSLSQISAVELFPSRTNSESYLIVRIENCSIKISDSSDLSLLKKIAEVFDHD